MGLFMQVAHLQMQEMIRMPTTSQNMKTGFGVHLVEVVQGLVALFTR